MPDLTKRESTYFIAFGLAGFTIMLGIISWWASTQPTCWQLYSNEQQAIQECEQ